MRITFSAQRTRTVMSQLFCFRACGGETRDMEGKPSTKVSGNFIYTDLFVEAQNSEFRRCKFCPGSTDADGGET